MLKGIGYPLSLLFKAFWIQYLKMGSTYFVKLDGRRIILQYLLPCYPERENAKKQYGQRILQSIKEEIFNSVFCKTIPPLKNFELIIAKDADRMIKKLKELYNEYKPYIRVDLIMYGVLILAIIIYFIVSAIID